MKKLEFNKYLKYDEIKNLLEFWDEQYPDKAILEVIGQSHEGRDVYAMTITDLNVSEAEKKPAMYVDANIHAGEVTGSMAALHLIDTLLTSKDEKVKRLLQTRTFYILPRINPDGAELYLTTPYTLRSSVRPFPNYRKDEDPAGLHAEDVNNDGKILLMRVRDDQHGAWKISPDDSRLMIKRKPYEFNGPFYHIYTEGVIKDEDGNIKEEVSYPYNPVKTKYGLDLNRNFPAGHDLHTPGSGPFPLSEPETRNQVEFINSKRNIGGVLLYHTTGGILFRPHSTIPDKDFAKEDVELYNLIGGIGTEATGYKVECCYGDIWSGVLDDWCFEKKGLFAFTPELWDAIGRAAPELKKKSRDELTQKEKTEIELKLLEWNDRELAGKGFINWTEFTHPQIGKVEIGGWDTKECRQNPPVKFLEQECYNMTQFALNYALSLPQVEIDETNVEKLSEDVYKIEVLVSNHGYLSTNISKQAKKQNAARKDRVKINLPDNILLKSGNYQEEFDFLDGYNKGQNSRWYRFGDPAECAKRISWTVQVMKDSNKKISIELISERGGHKSQEIHLS
ncbi:MAG: M14 family metallopeptidase [Clostridia bacterium]